MKIIKEHSAGGVVYRRKEKGRRKKEKKNIDWLVAKHSGYHKWVFPKGLLESGETPEETALREVEEETGIQAKIIKKIDFEVKYKYQNGETLIEKRVEFYLMEYESGDIKNHSWEMEEVRWLTGEKALELLAFEGEKEVLKRAI